MLTQDDVKILKQVLFRAPMMWAETLWAQSFLVRLEEGVAVQIQGRGDWAEAPKEDGDDKSDNE
jgi:hypothetical protein